MRTAGIIRSSDKKYVAEWNKRLTQKIEKGNKPEMIKYLRNYPINLDKYITSYIRYKNILVYKLYHNTKYEVVNDIRKYFEMKMRS